MNLQLSTASGPLNRAYSTRVFGAVVALAGAIGCTRGPALTPAALVSDSPPEVAPAQTGAPVASSRVAYYQRAFPRAVRFVTKPIPAVMIMPGDQGNDAYVEARSEDGALIGFLRDFTGPVSPGDDCGCNPLQLTLAFDREYVPFTYLAPRPLEKMGHEPFSPADEARLIEVLQAPPEELTRVRRTKDVVDGVSGATRKELGPHVVRDAALSTHRILQVAMMTSRILQGAPASRDRERLEPLLQEATAALSKARALAAFLPTAESPEIQRQAYRAMARSYVDALAQGEQAAAAVETALLSPPFPGEEQSREVAAACYALADRSLRRELVRRCVAQLGDDLSLPLPVLAHLRGTLEVLEGDVVAAAQSLATAADAFSIDEDPFLHLRYSQALTATGQLERACLVGKALFAAHPVLPDVRTSLVACRGLGEDIDDVIAAIRQQQRDALVAGRRAGTTAAPILSVEGPQLQTVELALAEPGKATVLVVFSTWCPHCRTELPRVVDFVASLQHQGDLRERVRVIGLRTAVERETESYPEFAQKLGLNFPIWSDATMSLAFARFARAHDLQTSLPTTAVLDPRGVLRFVMPRGEYRDTARELQWAVEAVLADEG